MNYRKYVLNTLKIALSVGIIAFIFIKWVNFREFVTTLKAAQPAWMLAAIVLLIAVVVINVYRWHLFLKMGRIDIHFFRTFRLFSVGMFFNTFMIGLNGGDLVKIYYIAKQSSKPVVAASTIVWDRLAGVAGLTFLVTASLLWNIHDSRLLPLRWPVLGVLSIGFIGALILFLMSRFSRGLAWLHRVAKKMSLEAVWEQVRASVKDCWAKPRVVIYTLFLSVLLHSSIVLANYAVGTSLGVTGMTLGQYALVVPVILFVSAIPVSISGWGVGEALYISLFGWFGVSPVLAVAISLSLRFFYIIIGVLSVWAYVWPGLTPKR